MPIICTIVDDPHKIDYEVVRTIFEAVGWGDRGGAQFLRRAFYNSSFSLFALSKSKGELMGFIRALSDGVYYATIQDFIVAPWWQKQGVGHCLLQELLLRLSHIPTVLAPALPQSASFYERYGFVQRAYSMVRLLNPQKELLFGLKKPPENLKRS